MRINSETPMKNGGYLHRIGDMFSAQPAPTPPPPPKHLPPDRVGSLWTHWGLQTDEDRAQPLAASLGVSQAALRLVGIAWAWPYDAWAFPMFDGKQEFRGIRFRSDAGDKWAYPGSRQGIFIPDADPPGDDCCICEGPTDLAALLTLGLWGLGRPSCTGGADEIRTYCKDHSLKTLTILADNDGPGRAGAERLARESRMRARIVTLPAKDVREAVRLGATRETIETCINNAAWKG